MNSDAAPAPAQSMGARRCEATAPGSKRAPPTRTCAHVHDVRRGAEVAALLRRMHLPLVCLHADPHPILVRRPQARRSPTHVAALTLASPPRTRAFRLTAATSCERTRRWGAPKKRGSGARGRPPAAAAGSVRCMGMSNSDRCAGKRAGGTPGTAPCSPAAAPGASLPAAAAWGAAGAGGGGRTPPSAAGAAAAMVRSEASATTSCADATARSGDRGRFVPAATGPEGGTPAPPFGREGAAVGCAAQRSSVNRLT